MEINADMLGPFAEIIGLELKTASGDEIVATWEARSELHQPYGILHGGVHCTVVETLGSIGAALWYGERGKVVGVSNSTDFFKTVSEGLVTSVARPLHRGRSQQVWLVETEDESGRIVARGQLRLHNIQVAEATT